MSRRFKFSIVKLYWAIYSLVHNKVNSKLLNYNSSIFITLPKRQHFFNFFNWKTKKYLNFSTGTFLSRMGRKQKFFKRNPKNIMTLTLQLKKEYFFFFKRIYIFYIHNFNYRQYTLYKKIMSLINPSILYLMHYQSFTPRFYKKRRIKRRVLRILKRQ